MGRFRFFPFRARVRELPGQHVNRGDRVQCQVERIPNYFHILFRSESASGEDTGAVDTLWYSGSTSILTDVPPLGNWYYRVRMVPTSLTGGSGMYRSSSTRIEFTGKLAGPAVTAINAYATRIDIAFTTDPEALAYVLERSGDGTDWATADTLGPGRDIRHVAGQAPGGRILELPHPDRAQGHALTEPGTSLPGLTRFIFGPQYDNSLQVYIENKGTRVYVALSGSFNYVFYLMRSDKGEWKDGQRFDWTASSTTTSKASSPIRLLRARGTIGCNREPTVPGLNDYIYRSVPTRVEFTGAPEITSLTKNQSYIQISFPYGSAPDVLEIHRSSGNPDDLAGYVLIHSVNASSFASTYFDTSVAGKTGFYHYRLAIRSGTLRTELGAVKSVYFEAAAGSGLSQGLLKQAVP